MSSSLKYVGLTILKSATITTTALTKSARITLISSATQSRTLHLSSLETKVRKSFIVPTTIPARNYCFVSVATQNKRNCLQPSLLSLSSSYHHQQYRFKTANKSISLFGRLIKSFDKKTKTLSSFHKYQKIMDAPPGIFKGSLDRFNGVTIDSIAEFNDCDNFPDKLKKSLDHWQAEKRRAIWFHVRTEHSEWVPYLTKMNFEFHHAKEGMVVLNRWLPEDEYPNLPVYSHTMLGVGGVVVNDKDEILVVSERFALIPNSWKLPGGYAEPNENIVDAAIREVREETGIETTFNTVISLRHAHGGPFGCSDIYCVVALTPTCLELKRCEREIAKVQWMPFAEYLQHPNVHETNRHFLRCYIEYKKRGIRLTCEKAQHQILKKEYCLYYLKHIEEEKEKNGQKDLSLTEGKL